MAIDKEIMLLLDTFNKKLVDDTRASLRAKLDERAPADSRFKGKESRLEASVYGAPSVFKNGSVTTTLTMNDYWAVVNDGRDANNVSSEGQDKIAEWSATRGLAEKIRITDLEQRKQRQSLSERKNLKTLKKMPFDRAKKAAGYLVARSLQKKSLEPTHFFDEVINDGRLQELEEGIAKILATEVLIDIRQSF
jgi:hypothetical protein